MESRLHSARGQRGPVRADAGQDTNLKVPTPAPTRCPTPSRMARRRWPTASWAGTASSTPPRSRPSALPSTKPSPGLQARPDRSQHQYRQSVSHLVEGIYGKSGFAGHPAGLLRGVVRHRRLASSAASKNKPFLIVSGERAVYAVWALMTLASGILVYALMTGDFRFAYVAAHTNRAMPTLYKFAAWWGGQEGSLLLLELAALHLRRGRGLHQPPQASRHDAVGRRRPRPRSRPSSWSSTTSSPTPSRCWRSTS